MNCSHGKPIPGECLACEKIFETDERLRLETQLYLDRVQQLVMENALRRSLRIDPPEEKA